MLVLSILSSSLMCLPAVDVSIRLCSELDGSSKTIDNDDSEVTFRSDVDVKYVENCGLFISHLLINDI